MAGPIRPTQIKPGAQAKRPTRTEVLQNWRQKLRSPEPTILLAALRVMISSLDKAKLTSAEAGEFYALVAPLSSHADEAVATLAKTMLPQLSPKDKAPTENFPYRLEVGKGDISDSAPTTIDAGYPSSPLSTRPVIEPRETWEEPATRINSPRVTKNDFDGGPTRISETSSPIDEAATRIDTVPAEAPSPKPAATRPLETVTLPNEDFDAAPTTIDLSIRAPKAVPQTPVKTAAPSVTFTTTRSIWDHPWWPWNWL